MLYMLCVTPSSPNIMADLDLNQSTINTNAFKATNCSFFNVLSWNNQTGNVSNLLNAQHENNLSSPSDSQETLLRLLKANDEVAFTLIPVIIYLGLLIILGFVGNSLVCFVFINKFRAGSQNFLIICLAVFDLLTCVFSLPYEIVDIRFYAYYIFPTFVICKVFKFVNTLCHVGSVFTLMIIAVDRYKKVCVPVPQMKQMKYGQIQVLTLMAVVLAIILSTPSAVVYGQRTTNSSFLEGLESRDCSISDTFSHTIFPTLYNGLLLLCIVGFSISLAVLYWRILQEVLRRVKRKRKSRKLGTPSAPDTYVSSNVSDDDIETSIGQPSPLPQKSRTISHLDDEKNARRHSQKLKVARTASLKNERTSTAIPDLSKQEDHAKKKQKVVTHSASATSKQSKPTLEVPKMRSHRGSYNITRPSKSPSLSKANRQKKKDPIRNQPHTVVEGNAKTLLDKEITNVLQPTTTATFLHKDDEDKEGAINISLTSSRSSSLNCKIQIEVDPCSDETASDSATPRTPTIRRSASDVIPASKPWPGYDVTSNGAHPSNEEEQQRPKFLLGLRRSNSDGAQHKKPATMRSLVTALSSVMGPAPAKPKPERSQSSKKRRRTRYQNTVVAFSVTAVFVLSFIPHLSLMLAKKVFHDYDQRLEGAGFVVYNIALRTYFLNSVSNPIIYGILNSQFRRHVRHMCRSLTQRIMLR